MACGRTKNDLISIVPKYDEFRHENDFFVIILNIEILLFIDLHTFDKLLNINANLNFNY